MLDNDYNSISMRLAAVKYALTAFRTKKTYLAFLIAQLILSIVIVLLALTSKTHFRTPIVIGLEFALFLSLAFDLYHFPHSVSSFGGSQKDAFATVRPTSLISVSFVSSQPLCSSCSSQTTTPAKTIAKSSKSMTFSSSFLSVLVT